VKGSILQIFFHVRNEAHVQHAVGFVDDEDVDLRQQKCGRARK